MKMFLKKIKNLDDLYKFVNENCRKDRNNIVTEKSDNNSNISSNEDKDKDKVKVDKNVTR